MTGYFDIYNVAIVDASLFREKLSEAFIAELRQIHYIYISGTFSAEVLELMELLPTRREIIDSNYRLFRETLSTSVMNLEAYPDCNNDIWDFLQLVSERPNADKAVLITGSLGLIQRVISCGLGIDIYDLNRKQLVGHVAYRNLAKKYFVDNEETPVCMEPTDKIDEGTTLYTGKGGPVTLGEMLGDGSGSEGNVFFLRQFSPECVAKIFKTGKFSVNKFRAVKAMVDDKSLNGIVWAKFPYDILYSDFQRSKPVGILEPYGKTAGSLYDDELFFGDTGNWSSSLLSVKVSDVLCLCKYITRQVCYLNAIGVYVSDFNIKNFDYPAGKTNPFIQMWDTDSFGYGNYFSGYMADNEKFKTYDVTRREDICEMCNDELYHFLFRMLTLSDYPFDPETGSFNYLSRDYSNYSRKEFVPKSIWEAFEKFYTGKTKASPQMMLYLLRKEMMERSANADLDLSYTDIVNRIDSSFLAEQDRMLDSTFSPALNLNPYGRHVYSSAYAPPKKKYTPPEKKVTPPKEKYTPAASVKPVQQKQTPSGGSSVPPEKKSTPPVSAVVGKPPKTQAAQTTQTAQPRKKKGVPGCLVAIAVLLAFILLIFIVNGGKF